jgi:hypothetical protein
LKLFCRLRLGVVRNVNKDLTMQEEDIIDHDFDASGKDLFEPIRWWERRRVWYNALLILVVFLAMTKYAEGVLNYGVSDAIVHSVIVCAIANVFYSVGWGIEVIIMYYYSDEFRMKSGLRMTFYVLGVLFSMALAWEMYSNTLRAYAYY